MDEVLRQSFVYGLCTTSLLSPTLYYYLPDRGRKWLRLFKKPVLTAMLLYLFYAAIPTDRRDLYTILDVDVMASKNDILQAYRTVSKKFHPDKVAAAEASGGAVPQRPSGFAKMTNEEFFMEIKKAQEVLMSDTRRSNYDRFGDYKYGETDEKTTIIVVCLSLVSHLLCFCVGFLVSYPRHVTFARQIYVVYNLAMFCNELQIRFVENGDSLAFLPYVSSLVPFERVHFFRSLFPCVLCASLCLAKWNFSDSPAKRLALLKALLSTNRVLTERTQELIRVTAYLKTMGTPSTAAIKTQQQQMNHLKSAALRARFAGQEMPVAPGAEETAEQAKETDKAGAQSANKLTGAQPKDKKDIAEWEDFTNTLNEEQKELFKRMVADQYRKTEAEEQARESNRRRFDINWGQVLMWVCILYVWIYYK
ncbi:putative DNAJ domain-containing protein [Neospora caninum Liverpool]|uniref:DnaJ domain-containing protein, putative n=1 Tax=Neospora caninum (strain Liverpool) TaxID=572307 RepID=F0VAU2_NEOCL|nr:putative DNAJ domain-containing protein [Neospora caninum Liverpool]CBZ50800.1 putative DNAJ domain-containing protein [Neospora caninum Liverpool]CEL68101.1 TPA: DnaJ domain-containing protein, putative [Neospora caninum Liverpool]|eukprot:XP_003880833.1 putative DNAJ domain-containing protein [Neospora caninum Liverpool]